MEKSIEVEQDLFVCSLCDLHAPYRYYGSKPKGSRKVVFIEEVYVMDNPFSQDKELLVLGGHCSICNCCVCVDETCSLFHGKRFCTSCIQRDDGSIPHELRNKSI